MGGCDPPDASIAAPHLQVSHHPPTLLIHCNGDEFVDGETSKMLLSHLKRGGVQSMYADVTPGAAVASFAAAAGPNTDCGHNWPAGADQWILHWFDEYITPPAGALKDAEVDGLRLLSFTYFYYCFRRRTFTF